MARIGGKWLNNIWLSKSALIGFNAMLLPFGLPLIVWLVVCQCYSAVLSGLTGSTVGAVAATFLGALPCGLLYAVGLSGALFGVKSVLVDGEMDIKRKFAAGIRKNARAYLLFAFTVWASLTFAVVTPSLYAEMDNGMLYGAGLIVSIVQAAAVVPAMCLAAAECAFFDDKLRRCYANAFKLYFMRPVRTLGATIVLVLPFALCTVLPFVWQLACWVVYSVIGVSIGMVFYVWYCKKYFDGIVGRSVQTKDVLALGKDDEIQYTAVVCGESEQIVEIGRGVEPQSK